MSINKKQYLGIYFKTCDQDLIDWKDKFKRNLTGFAKQAIREKLERDKEESRMEHPVVFLRRMEAQQIQIFAMIQKILTLFINGIITNQSTEQDSKSIIVPSLNDLDSQCVEAGWD